jgi:hypothetical protein
MVCKCVNDEGAPALDCDGTCSSERMVNPESQYRNQEDGFTQKQCELFRRMIRHELCNAPIINKAWIDGFIEGFKYGRENY